MDNVDREKYIWNKITKSEPQTIAVGENHFQQLWFSWQDRELHLTKQNKQQQINPLCSGLAHAMCPAKFPLLFAKGHIAFGKKVAGLG